MMRPPFQTIVMTLFPELFPGPLGFSVTGRGLEKGLWSLHTVNIRDFAQDKHRTVDDTPYGGGPGMVMKPEVVGAAIDHVHERFAPEKILCLSPRGKKIDQQYINSLAQMTKIGLLCGRYEGIDDRVVQKYAIEEVSLGDFVLCGGELPALCLMEACVRLIPGVMGDENSHRDESFQQDLLEYPHYTKPADWDGMRVPDVLLSGNHEKINLWRKQQAERITQARRPDLWKAYLGNL